MAGGSQTAGGVVAGGAGFRRGSWVDTVTLDVIYNLFR